MNKNKICVFGLCYAGQMILNNKTLIIVSHKKEMLSFL